MTIKFNRIDVDTGDFESSITHLEQKLLHALRSELAQSDNQSFVFIAKSVAGEIIGGVAASTSYNWLLIKLLWVDESCRESGLGKQLMELAEQHGANVGCHSAWLDTSNPKAERFYKKNGYSEFGRLENESDHQPPTHRRWFLKKTL